ncbi:MAG: hypothetical protein JSR82_18230 [Verrucomicrobia bacterium]|nr:hypothetical protein [Verrucomicrobiota bacterium]
MRYARLVAFVTLWLLGTLDAAAENRWKVELRATAAGTVVQVAPVADPKRATDVCEVAAGLRASAYLSPTDDVLIVQSTGASLGTSLRVFLLTEGTEFLELTDWKLDDAIEKARARAKAPPLSRPRLGFVAWSADGSAALLCSGADGEAFYVVADFSKRQLSAAALDRLNRRAPGAR